MRIKLKFISEVTFDKNFIRYANVLFSFAFNHVFTSYPSTISSAENY
jgi:hypothetical protein